MGSLILCHKKKAKQPYEITRIHLSIYSIEELCYYICNNLYLIDHTIMNSQICDWISDELELRDLGKKLKDELSKNCSEEQYVLTILKESNIYASSEINKIQHILEQLQDQNEVEREKYKADSLFKSGEYASAALVYQSILNKEWDDSLEKEFYGHVYACLGTAYGRLLLYEEAAKMYYKAYQICEEPEQLKVYLYCCYRAFPEEQYTKLLSGNAALLSLNSVLKEELKRMRMDMDLEISQEQLAVWKREYRRIDKSR